MLRLAMTVLVFNFGDAHYNGLRFGLHLNPLIFSAQVASPRIIALFEIPAAARNDGAKKALAFNFVDAHYNGLRSGLPLNPLVFSAQVTSPRIIALFEIPAAARNDGAKQERPLILVMRIIMV